MKDVRWGAIDVLWDILDASEGLLLDVAANTCAMVDTGYISVSVLARGIRLTTELLRLRKGVVVVRSCTFPTTKHEHEH